MCIYNKLRFDIVLLIHLGLIGLACGVDVLLRVWDNCTLDGVANHCVDKKFSRVRCHMQMFVVNSFINVLEAVL